MWCQEKAEMKFPKMPGKAVPKRHCCSLACHSWAEWNCFDTDSNFNLNTMNLISSQSSESRKWIKRGGGDACVRCTVATLTALPHCQNINNESSHSCSYIDRFQSATPNPIKKHMSSSGSLPGRHLLSAWGRNCLFPTVKTKLPTITWRWHLFETTPTKVVAWPRHPP